MRPHTQHCQPTAWGICQSGQPPVYTTCSCCVRLLLLVLLSVPAPPSTPQTLRQHTLATQLITHLVTNQPLPVQQVHHTPRCANHHIHTTPQSVHLRQRKEQQEAATVQQGNSISAPSRCGMTQAPAPPAAGAQLLLVPEAALSAACATAAASSPRPSSGAAA